MDACNQKLPILPQFDGIIPLAKPAGPSSAQCLVSLKRQGQKKIGHAGTLDPMAAGVLIVLLGQATKLSGWLLNSGGKVYSGTIRLGLETDTWDIHGKTIAERPCSHLGAQEITDAIGDWESLAWQEVPAYSAAKHKGQPLYKLARKGQDTPVKRKSVRIHSATVLALNMPFVNFRVSCGSGSYIRSLAHSLGMRLGCGAALASLTREYSHPFTLGECVEMEEIRNGLWPAHVRPLMDALPDWPQVQLDPEQIRAARNGGSVAARGACMDGPAFLCAGETPLAIATLDSKASFWQVRRGLWNN